MVENEDGQDARRVSGDISIDRPPTRGFERRRRYDKRYYGALLPFRV